MVNHGPKEAMLELQISDRGYVVIGVGGSACLKIIIFTIQNSIIIYHHSSNIIILPV